MRGRAAVRICQRHLARVTICGQLEIQQPVRVVECRPQHLPAGRILERGRYAPVAGHLVGIDRARTAKSRQCRAVGADQKNRLDQIATRLLDRQRGKVGIIK